MSNFIIVDTTPADIRARTLIEALIDEYSTRYAPYRIDSRGEVEHELARYPDELFSPPDGAFILVIRDGKTVGGDAFRRYDAQTVELKRVWTHLEWRRQGLARTIVAALEQRAKEQGYRRAYLTTGVRQPEAWALYVDTGYTPFFDGTNVPETDVNLHSARIS
ncbi:GNAT superfamily N-acetyltransferase [Paraburkholderia caledonica]|uniref:GNAT superfamily N-acetyltransferase n=1 Tax=Paraburkholderia caledonica TaxID=134536 RepID=A0AB73IPT6_9BURK|nr:GNAT superfamily N-acetyltransferase [Paraburkholderia caledonica]